MATPYYFSELITGLTSTRLTSELQASTQERIHDHGA